MIDKQERKKLDKKSDKKKDNSKGTNLSQYKFACLLIYVILYNM